DLTDEDADQLRALQILRGELYGQTVSVPLLDQIDLLVLDGFFDFTPVQGEILKYLIPLIPEVIVNLNGDSRNPDIFRPFQSTIDHLTSIDEFEIHTAEYSIKTTSELSPLRARLFNVDARESSATPGESANNRQDAGEPQAGMPALQLFECADRELE